MLDNLFGFGGRKSDSWYVLSMIGRLSDSPNMFQLT